MLPRTVALKPYAPTDRGAVHSLEVQVEHGPAETLRLRYTLHADFARLRIPQPKPPRQTDELWQHTCFEAFIRGRSGTAYRELNVSPSTEWALYSFADYRKGLSRVSIEQPPEIHVEQSGQRLQVSVRLALDPAAALHRIALAAVIEHEDGRLSYWALTHPASKPDFHHPDGFILEL